MFYQININHILAIPRPIKRAIVFFLDVILCWVTVWLSFGLRLDFWGWYGNSQWVVYIISILLLMPLATFFGLYRAIFRYVGADAFLAIVRVLIIYSLLFFLVLTVAGLEGVPRSIGIIQPILLFILIGISRYAALQFFSTRRNTQNLSYRLKPNTLIYGAGLAGRQLAAGLSVNKEILIKGFVDDNPNLQNSIVNGLYVYPPADLKQAINRLGITDVLLALPSITQDQRSNIIESLYGCGVRVRSVPGLMEMTADIQNLSELNDLDMNDLLGRKVVPPDISLLRKNIDNQDVLVTGAGGSIGSELCRQIIKLRPRSLTIVDSSEHSLYLIHEELKRIVATKSNIDLQSINQPNLKLSSQKGVVKITACLGSVRDSELISKIFRAYTPSIVFHAAAYKHVPLVEQNISEGINNNVFGTLVCAKASIENGVSHFILVSTDKAVRPTNIMGASKRVAELILQALARESSINRQKIIFSMVRFGNVLGSSGSVAPLFISQIKAGGPVTLTHKDITRYFMTIPEAAQLVIQASSMASGGDVFVLDMGEPVRIYDLAVRMIYLSGFIVRDELNPNGDIEIEVTGLRPGEKLYEELLIGANPQKTEHPKILRADEEFFAWLDLDADLERLNLAIRTDNNLMLQTIFKKIVSGYRHSQN